ncbi:hypothetical protein AB0H51_09785 [Streptomyces griseoluteus]|uniref:MmyB family transcriptional regulator n=1 Tax=Streptomyces griseoluteus TaxID=29306 RepID=UPI0033F0743C
MLHDTVGCLVEYPAEGERRRCGCTGTHFSRRASDPSLAALVTKLRRLPRFLSWWAEPTVGDLQSARKIVVHPQAGEMALESSVLTIQRADLRLVVFLPRPDTDARSKLDLVATMGLEQWV